MAKFSMAVGFCNGQQYIPAEVNLAAENYPMKFMTTK